MSLSSTCTCTQGCQKIAMNDLPRTQLAYSSGCFNRGTIKTMGKKCGSNVSSRFFCWHPKTHRFINGMRSPLIKLTKIKEINASVNSSSAHQSLYSQATLSVKNQDILSDLSLHFTLARSFLKIASFEFANLLYFKSAFMNLKIARLALNAKCEVVVFTQSSRQ